MKKYLRDFQKGWRESGERDRQNRREMWHFLRHDLWVILRHMRVGTFSEAFETRKTTDKYQRN